MRKKTQEEEDEQGVYQLDLAASVFAIMLIYLLIVAHEVLDNQQKTIVTHYKPKDQANANFLLQTWRPLNTYEETWVLRNGKIFRLNMAAVSNLFKANHAAPDSSPAWNGNISFGFPPRGGSNLPTEYSFRYALPPGSELEPGLSDRSYPLSSFVDPGGSLTPDAASRFAEPCAIHILGDADDNAYRFLHALQVASNACEIILGEGDTLVITRYQLDYALNKIFR
jgi:hypothetical protein